MLLYRAKRGLTTYLPLFASFTPAAGWHSHFASKRIGGRYGRQIRYEYPTLSRSHADLEQPGHSRGRARTGWTRGGGRIAPGQYLAPRSVLLTSHVDRARRQVPSHGHFLDRI